ncbi:MAG: restriction endonuclease subunit S [Gemmatimonadaceae bacterium]
MTLPAGWKAGRLGAICSIEIGGTPSRDVPEYWDFARDTDNAWVSIKDMRCRVINETAEHISDAGVRHSNVKLQPPGAVLLSFKLTIGRVAVAGIPLYTNEAIAGLEPSGLSPAYLFYGLQHWDLLKGVDQAIKGATLNKEKLKRIEFEYPTDESEQFSIAEILSTVDRALEQTEAAIAKQQRIKTGLVHDLLTLGIDECGNLRSQQAHEFKDSPLGRIPVEWDALAIQELATHVGSGVTPRGGADVYTKEGVLFIRSQNVHFGGLRLDDVAYLPQHVHVSMRRSEVFANDVLLNITGASIGRCCPMPAFVGTANVNQHVCAIRLRGQPTDADAGLLSAILESSIGQNQIAQFNAGGNREGLNFLQIRSFLISWPRMKSERDTSYNLIRESENTLTAFRNAARKLRLIKTGLMQDLLTGERRVTALRPDSELATA